MSDKKRVDGALVERGLAQSREKAQALVMSGVVYIGENKVDKASAQVMPEDELIVRQTGTGYVSRMRNGERLTVTRSPHDAQLVRFPRERNFFSLLKDKLSQWSL